MLVTQCPRCQESVSVPDSLCTSPEALSSVEAQCPWCLATLGANDLRAIVPPALVILGEEAELQSVGASSEEWTNQVGNGVGIASEQPASSAAGLGTVAGLAAATGLASAMSETDPTEAIAELPDLNFESDNLAEPSGDLAEPSGDAEDFEPIDFGDDKEVAMADGEQSDDSDMFSISDVDADATDLEVSELGEFAVADANPSTEQDSGVLAPVMMDLNSTRRRKSGGGIKTMLGVGLGGLMALPIVGLILHFLGKPVPVMGDFLESYIPMKNKAVASRAAAPMSIDPPVVLDDRPMQGRSLAEEMSAEEFNPGGVSPAESAIAELGMDDPTEPAAIPESSAFSLPADAIPGGGENPPSGPQAMDESDADSMPAATLDSLPSEEMPTNEASPATSSDRFGTDPVAEPDSGTDDLFGSASEPSPNDDLFGNGADSMPESSPPSEMREEPADTAFDVQSETVRLAQSIANVSQMDANAPEKEAAINDLFSDLSKLAASTSEESIEPARPVLQAIASDMSLVKAFALAAPAWIGKSAEERQSDGALVVGKVGGTPENPTIFLSNKQELAVSLPAGQTEFPEGIQIGLGKVEGEGSASTISLSMLQGL